MSENFAILHPSRSFSENFAEFINKYGVQTPLQRLNDPFSSAAQFNSFYTRLPKGIP